MPCAHVIIIINLSECLLPGPRTELPGPCPGRPGTVATPLLKLVFLEGQRANSFFEPFKQGFSGIRTQDRDSHSTSTPLPLYYMGLFYVLTIKGLFYVHETPIL